ncbi:MAG: hypothetical protein M0Z70_06470, partial [Nitrospiraceae bacterium]|nr:hypothetical protein [Nitrospiraceae bacterium]
MIDSLEDKIILSGYSITKEEALQLVQIQPSAFSIQHFFNLFSAANRIRETFRGNSVDLCSIVNAKSGACPEDCSYCAQSSKSKTEVLVYPLVKKDIVIDKAKEAKDAGVKRFCVVTSGRKIGKNELIEIASMITDIRSIGL